jgi:hypothetical protein
LPVSAVIRERILAGPMIEWALRDVAVAVDRRSDDWRLTLPSREGLWSQRTEPLVLHIENETVAQLGKLLPTLATLLDWQEWTVTVANVAGENVSYRCGEMRLEREADEFVLIVPVRRAELDLPVVTLHMDEGLLTRLSAITNRFQEVQKHG